MGLPFAIFLTGLFLVTASRRRPADQAKATDGWWWLGFIGWWLLAAGGLLWLVWAAIRIVRW